MNPGSNPGGKGWCYRRKALLYSLTVDGMVISCTVALDPHGPMIWLELGATAARVAISLIFEPRPKRDSNP